MPKITPFLWFNKNAEEAVDFYLSIFPNSRRVSELRSPVQSSVQKGEVITITFELDGNRFTALNGGMDQPYSESISFTVPCAEQREIDHYWNALTADGGAAIQCGWLRDKYGVRWQIVPKDIADLIRTPAGMKAMMSMTKFDIAALEAANVS